MPTVSIELFAEFQEKKRKGTKMEEEMKFHYQFSHDDIGLFTPNKKKKDNSDFHLHQEEAQDGKYKWSVVLTLNEIKIGLV